MPDGQAAPLNETGPSASQARGGTGNDGGVLIAFTLTTFLSALLLFSVQPMFAKMVLPVLGGAPSVWAVAMCFFQAALLAGYCYAHFLIARVPLALTGIIHLVLCVAAFLVLPIGLPEWFGEPPAGEPYLWQLGLFAVAVGLPFVAVAANAPLTQAWFATTGGKHAKDPYFLYAASNLGSLIALLGYPFVLEPIWGVRVLSGYWTLGYALLIACLAGLFMIVLKRRSASSGTAEAATVSELAAARPSWSDRLGWIGLALVPSALLTAFTTHIATDVASAPLIWVIPLSLYLLTFVLVFRERSFIPRDILLPLHLVSVVVALLIMAQTRNEGWFVTAPIGTLAFFLSAMVAHRTLYESRPAARHLTEFYLWMSLGGALGGLAAALIAPKIFSEVFEYPLLLALSMACRPGALTLDKSGDRRNAREELILVWLMVAVGLLLIYWIPWLVERTPTPSTTWDMEGVSRAAWWITDPLFFARKFFAWLLGWGATPIVAAIFALILVLNWRRPARQLMAAMLMVLTICWLPSSVKQEAALAQRSYFGVYRVKGSYDGQWNTLVHGTTLHGAQRVRDNDGNPVADISPATYYYEGSPMARTVVAAREVTEAQNRKGKFGVIGLGTGSLACHAAEGEAWRFFEIDPVMIDIAVKSDHFTFMQNCQPNADIVIGDARLTMAKEPDNSYDLIIVDAFSSDAVPVHLMTAEALRLYLNKLTPTGVVLLHISNRYLDLDSVLASTVNLVPGAHGILVSDDAADGSYAQSTSTVAIFSHTSENLEKFKETGTASDLIGTPMAAWTDDHSDILAPFMSKYRKRYPSEE